MENLETIKDKLLVINNNLEDILNDYDINSFDNYGNNILHYYLKNRNAINIDPEYFLNTLKDKGLNFDSKQSKAPGHSALHLAVLKKDKIMTVLLVSLGVDVNTIDAYGNTPLIEAIMNYKDDDPFYIKYLVSNGASIYLKNKYGVSAYSLSERITNYDSKSLLIE